MVALEWPAIKNPPSFRETLKYFTVLQVSVKHTIAGFSCFLGSDYHASGQACFTKIGIPFNRFTPVTLHFPYTLSVQSTQNTGASMKIRKSLLACFLFAVFVGCAESPEDLAQRAEAGDFSAMEKMAEQGNVEMQSLMAKLYRAGEAVPQDDAKAIKFMLMSAGNGKIEDQGTLGLMYSEGWLVEKDSVEGVKWFRMAAEKGNANAQYNLGLSYLAGDGVPKDESEAFSWFFLADLNGSDDSKKILEALREQFTPQEVMLAQKRGIELFKMYDSRLFILHESGK